MWYPQSCGRHLALPPCHVVLRTRTEGSIVLFPCYSLAIFGETYSGTVTDCVALVIILWDRVQLAAIEVLSEAPEGTATASQPLLDVLMDNDRDGRQY